jgi:hypothetical protein
MPKTSGQLDLFPAGSSPAPEPPAPPLAFVRGVPVDRTGLAGYAHLVQDEADPARSERPVGGRKDRMPLRTLALTTVDHWRDRLLAHLADGEPRTFNRIGVELLDHTADMLYRTVVDRALWSVVDEQLLEHTWTVPVFFRLAQLPEEPRDQAGEGG